MHSRYEAVSMSAMASASTRKNAPVTPPSIRNGTKMASVQSVEPVSVGSNSAMAPLGVAPGIWARCARCSTTTIASSSTRPTAAAMPPSVIMLSDWPAADSPSRVNAMLPGRITAPASPSFKLRRNSTMTKMASSAPNSRLSRTPPMDPRTSWD